MRFHPIRAVAVVLASLMLAMSSVGEEEPASAGDSELAQQVGRLVRQLNDDSATERAAAEQQLLNMAGTTAVATDRFLALLPAENDQMPLAVRERLTRIRRRVEDRAAKSAIEATTVTLAADQMPLTEVFAAIEKQTGNRFADRSGQFGGDDPAADRPAITVSFKNEPYWSAVDQVLDKAGLGVYGYAGDDALAVVARGDGQRPRFGQAVYSGPFRVEVLEVQVQRNLRRLDAASLRLQLEVAWEPRLRPIAVSQSAADLTAVDAAGQVIAVSQPEAMAGAEIPAGTQATELVLSFTSPPRDVAKIASLRGTLRALVPGRQVKFRFGELAKAAGKSQRIGGVEVVIDAVRKNNAIWEIHMRLRLDEDNHAMESHRGWALQNLSYLVDDEGEPIDNAGLETTKQIRNEVGVAYFFDLPDGVDGLTWVYETPAAIVELPVDYELKEIPLP